MESALLIIIAVALLLLLISMFILIRLFTKIYHNIKDLGDRMEMASVHITTMYRDTISTVEDKSKFINDKLLIIENRQTSNKEAADTIIKCLHINNDKVNALRNLLRSNNKAKYGYKGKSSTKRLPSSTDTRR